MEKVDGLSGVLVCETDFASRGNQFLIGSLLENSRIIHVIWYLLCIPNVQSDWSYLFDQFYVTENCITLNKRTFAISFAHALLRLIIIQKNCNEPLLYTK